MTEDYRQQIEQILSKWSNDDHNENLISMKRVAAGYAVFFTELMADGMTREEAFDMTMQMVLSLSGNG